MKKRIIALCLLASLSTSLLLTACGSESSTIQSSSTSGTNSESQSFIASSSNSEIIESVPTEIVEYEDLVLYKDDNFILYLNSISPKGIFLSIDNKTNKIYKTEYLGVALDGQTCSDGGWATFDDLAPDTINEGQVHCTLDNTHHKTISGAFQIHDSDYTFETVIQFNDINIGKEKNLQWEPSSDKNKIYSDDTVTCNFYSFTGNAVTFEIKNTSDKPISAYSSPISIDRKKASEYGNFAEVLPNTSSLLEVSLSKTYENYDKITGSIQIFDGIDGVGTVEVPIIVEK